MTYKIKCIKGLEIKDGVSILAGEIFDYTGNDEFEGSEFSRNPKMYSFFTEEQLANHFEMIS